VCSPWIEGVGVRVSDPCTGHRTRNLARPKGAGVRRGGKVAMVI
jgi:hypothetical protein